jgi:hypothetical protein
MKRLWQLIRALSRRLKRPEVGRARSPNLDAEKKVKLKPRAAIMAGLSGLRGHSISYSNRFWQ